MDESLKTSVAEIVGKVLEARDQIQNNLNKINALKEQIENLRKENSSINHQIEADKRLIDYVLETGEDPVAARLTLNQKEINKKTQDQARIREASYRDKIYGMDELWHNDHILDERSSYKLSQLLNTVDIKNKYP